MTNALLGFGPFMGSGLIKHTVYMQQNMILSHSYRMVVTIITMRRVNRGLCVAAVREDSDVIKSNIPTCIHPPLIHEHKL